jgi:ATP-binding cassette subfamily B protein RaxB
MSWISRYFHNKTASQPGIIQLVKCKNKGGDGLACIAMIFAYYGIHISISHLYGHYPSLRKRIGLSDILDILLAHEIASQPLHCKLKEVEQVSLPAILFWGSEKFTILSEIIDEEYVVFDPTAGKLVLPKIEFERYYTEIVLQISPPAGSQGIPLRCGAL